jgi:hypothetical protein
MRNICGFSDRPIDTAFRYKKLQKLHKLYKQCIFRSYVTCKVSVSSKPFKAFILLKGHILRKLVNFISYVTCKATYI